MLMTSSTIKFVHEDRILEIKNPNPNETILNYVRTKLRKTGSTVPSPAGQTR